LDGLTSLFSSLKSEALFIINKHLIFFVVYRNGNKEILNKQAGHLVRSKVADSDEGGVAAGYGVLDSPYLT
jgi:glutathione synthase